MDIYDYRLIEKVYCNRIENEDGPGSLQNVISSEKIRIIKKWTEQKEDFGVQLIENHSLDLSEDSDDGFIEFSHLLERRRCGSDKWEFVGCLYPMGMG